MERNDLFEKNIISKNDLSINNTILNDLKNLNQTNLSEPKILLKLTNNILDNCTKELLNNKNINLDNIKEAIPKAKLKEGFSKAVDSALDLAKRSNLLPDFICNTLKVTKDYFMQDKIDKKITKYISSLEKSINSIQKDISNWQKAYNNGDLEGMRKALDSTKKHVSKLIPIESIKERFNNMIYVQKCNNAQENLKSEDKTIVDKATETINLCQKLMIK